MGSGVVDLMGLMVVTVTWIPVVAAAAPLPPPPLVGATGTTTPLLIDATATLELPPKEAAQRTDAGAGMTMAGVPMVAAHAKVTVVITMAVLLCGGGADAVMPLTVGTLGPMPMSVTFPGARLVTAGGAGVTAVIFPPMFLTAIAVLLVLTSVADVLSLGKARKMSTRGGTMMVAAVPTGTMVNA